eukprot:CAMPEP_0117790846 /NCGR_PEP_ID=MMETSP0948-20121206/8511_1 /TAXON_ID=44440 /ORGANISM="Chattonella subsalsa, Strain CCMP2191" /LENGTH=74 /DNA_ID=CAMNT_0005620799 /DNA_START=529 /DNA_END=753 /DNA_ORIENTATION=-
MPICSKCAVLPLDYQVETRIQERNAIIRIQLSNLLANSHGRYASTPNESQYSLETSTQQVIKHAQRPLILKEFL